MAHWCDQHWHSRAFVSGEDFARHRHERGRRRAHHERRGDAQVSAGITYCTTQFFHEVSVLRASTLLQVCQPPHAVSAPCRRWLCNCIRAGDEAAAVVHATSIPHRPIPIGRLWWLPGQVAWRNRSRQRQAGELGRPAVQPALALMASAKASVHQAHGQESCGTSAGKLFRQVFRQFGWSKPVPSWCQALLEAERSGTTWRDQGLKAAPHFLDADGTVKVPQNWQSMVRCWVVDIWCRPVSIKGLAHAPAAMGPLTPCTYCQ